MPKKSSGFRRFVSGFLLFVALAGGVVLVGGWLIGAGGQPAQAAPDLGRLEAESPLRGEVVTATLYLPLVRANFASPPSIFGVQMTKKVDNAAGLNQAVAAQMRWLRLGAFHWDDIEPVRTAPPTYNWSVVDEQSLSNARSRGMEMIAIVQFTPAWAQAIPGSYCGPIRQDALGAYAEFLTALVNRYSAPPYSIRYWELGNEPDVDPSLVGPNSGFGCWGDKDDPYYGGGYYAEMLKVAYPAIKAADADAQVLIGGLLLDCNPNNPPPGKDCKPSKYLEGILLNGGGPYFDIVSFHAYTYYLEDQDMMANPNWPGSITVVPDKTLFLQSVLAQNGYAGKPLMNTEAALLCFADTTACREAQAKYVPRAYAEALSLGIQSQIYFALVNQAWWSTGLLRADLTPKPAYYTYATAASILASVDYEGLASGYPAGIEGYAFHQHGASWDVDVIWAWDGGQHAVTLPAGASAFDRYGNLLATSGTIQVDGAPVYVQRH
jgi:hypothetical protein